MLGALHGPWLLGAALLLLLLAIGRAPRPRRGECLAVLGIGIVAAGLRLGLGRWSLAHVNGQGPGWILGTLDVEALSGYGPGYFELYNWIVRQGGPPDRIVFAGNALLAALSPMLLYAVARGVGVARGGALAVAVVLAGAPVLVYTAASEGYHSALIAMTLAAQWALALATAARGRDDRPAAAFAVAAAALFATAAARTHPVIYLPLALSPLVVLLAAPPPAWRSRLALAAVAAAAIGGTVLLTSGGYLLRALDTSAMTGQVVDRLALGHYPLPLAALLAVWALHRWLVPPWLPLFGVLSLGLMLATQDSFQQHPLWGLCYQHLFLPGILLGAAPLLPRWLQSAPKALASAAAALLLLLSVTGPRLGAPTTEQLEHGFLREALRDLPPGCTLAAVSRAGRRMWEIPSYLLPRQRADAVGARRSVQEASDLDAVGADECVIYVHSSLCSSEEGRGLCDAVEQRARLERLAGRTFAAAPSYTGLPYDRAEVEVAVFRVVGSAAPGARPRVSDGAAITPAFAQALYDRLASLRAGDGCTLARFDTQRFRIAIHLTTPSGEERGLELSTASGGATGRRVGRWTLAVPPELERECGATLSAIVGVLAETA